MAAPLPTPSPDWGEHGETIVYVLIWAFGVCSTAAVVVIQWLLLRAVRNVDTKIATALTAIFGDGQGVLGIQARLLLLEHDYARCCGDWDGHDRRTAPHPATGAEK